jgi:hypothetical protein
LQVTVDFIPVKMICTLSLASLSCFETEETGRDQRGSQKAMKKNDWGMENKRTKKRGGRMSQDLQIAVLVLFRLC